MKYRFPAVRLTFEKRKFITTRNRDWLMKIDWFLSSAVWYLHGKNQIVHHRKKYTFTRINVLSYIRVERHQFYNERARYFAKWIRHMHVLASALINTLLERSLLWRWLKQDPPYFHLWNMLHSPYFHYYLMTS